MRTTKGIAATVFSAVAAKGINVRMIASGSSNQNLSLIVTKKDAKETVRAIHSAFHLEKLNSHPRDRAGELAIEGTARPPASAL